jgi:hypothetical protein
MSALGQKQTSASQKVMSALPPKADMCGATRDVRFGPIAGMAAPSITSSARNRNASEIFNPIALAALRFNRLMLLIFGFLPDRITEKLGAPQGKMQDISRISSRSSPEQRVCDVPFNERAHGTCPLIPLLPERAAYRQCRSRTSWLEYILR